MRPTSITRSARIEMRPSQSDTFLARSAGLLISAERKAPTFTQLRSAMAQLGGGERVMAKAR
jgi:hypothetical protein